jgi:hypothetical protein
MFAEFLDEASPGKFIDDSGCLAVRAGEFKNGGNLAERSVFSVTVTGEDIAQSDTGTLRKWSRGKGPHLGT